MKWILRVLLFLPSRILRYPIKWATNALTSPRELYNPSEVTNLRALKGRVKVGDVLLVAGNARISHIVKVLTFSPWSHVVLYVGDRSELLSEEDREFWAAKHGYESLKHLVIDADPLMGVHLRPIDEWCGLMIRHCRGAALKTEDVNRVVDHALGQLGREYDTGHIVRLLFFFAFPWEILPTFVRKIITDFELSESDRICSRVLAEAFHSVNYPIRPTLFEQNHGTLYSQVMGTILGTKNRSRTSFRLLFAGKMAKALKRFSDDRYVEIHFRGTRHLTPADYDLSRFFSIIKDENDQKIDYRNAKVLCTWSPGNPGRA